MGTTTIARFAPATRLRGEVRPPADKSISHRAAILGAMAGAPVKVTNYLAAADTSSTLDAIRAVGAAIATRPDGTMTITGVGLRGARAPGRTIDVGNAGTLMRLLPGWLAAAGAALRRRGAELRIEPAPPDGLQIETITVPGDPSSAAFPIAAALLVPGSHVVIRGASANWTRTGFVRIARRMGADIEGELEAEPGGAIPRADPIADLEVRASDLHGTVVEPDEVPLAIDELPLVALLGCFAAGRTVVRGAQELRVKETDRIATVVDGLRGLGAEIEATEDGFVVHGTGGLRGGVLAAHGDHRLAMLGAVAGLASRDGVEVEGMDAAAVSYPGFEADLETLLR